MLYSYILFWKEGLYCNLSGFKHYKDYQIDTHWPDLYNCGVDNIRVVCTHVALEGGAMRTSLCL